MTENSERRAAEWAESKVGLDNPVTGAAARRAIGGRKGRWKRVGLRKKEVAVVAVHEGVFSRPLPYGNEEELENLVVVNEISWGGTRNASACTVF